MISFRCLRDHEIAVAGPGPLGVVSAEQYRAGLGRRTYRPEWTWIAEDDGRTVARAVWWGRPDGDRPLVLDCLWAADPSGVAALLAAAHRAFPAAPEAYRLIVPNGWHDDPAARAEVAWRRTAAAAAGFTHEVERLRFEWTPAAGVTGPAGRLTFAAEPDDARMLAVFLRIGDGSLDDGTRRNRARMSPLDAAREEMDFYLSAPGERSWWRTAHTPDGALAGLAVPSATAESPNVGYLGVVPRMRGRGYARQILDEITRGHAARGAERITATTDVANFPMAAAFRAAGYRNTETRLMLSAH